MPFMLSSANDLLISIGKTVAANHRRRLKKVVIIGDRNTGKTTILRKLPTCQPANGSSDSLRALKYEVEPTKKSMETRLIIWDNQLAGFRSDSRPATYSKTDLVVICYAIDSMDSLFSVQCKWLPEARQFCPGVPILLLANKKDLREDTDLLERMHTWGEHVVSEEEGRNFANKMGVDFYVECSAFAKEGLDELLQCLGLALFSINPYGKSSCTIL